MKNAFLFSFILFFSATVSAQKQTYDHIKYAAPEGITWKKEIGNNYMSFSTVHNNKKDWCQIVVYKLTASKGSLEADFTSEWNNLTGRPQKITAGPHITGNKVQDGWQVQTAGGKAVLNGAEIMVLHTVYSGYNNCISIVARTNHGRYLPAIENFSNSIELIRPGALSDGNNTSMPGNFRFTQTNWEDGWVTIASQNWAEVKKDNIRVLIHYPDTRADAYHSVLREGLLNAWNILVAPRYTEIRNLVLKPVQSFESIAFAEADAIDKASGQPVHIVLFKKHFSNGNGRYLEFITPDKATFEREFGVYRNEESGWEKLSDMQNRNRFSVAASDLPGKWQASDYASLTYYYVNNGGYAGATATSIAHEFIFFNNGKYQSDHAGASGSVGNQRFSRQQYKGSFSVNNWEMQLSNRFQNTTEKFNCYFEAVKNGRILLMTDKHNTTISLVKAQ